MAYLRDWSGRAGLTVHPTKTRIVQVKAKASTSWLALSRQQEVAAQEEPSETARQAATANPAHARMEPGGDSGQGQSDPAGWHGYFRESHRTGLNGPDGWLRRRLRAMLRKRRSDRATG